MKRPLVVAVLVASLLLPGCATPPPLLPPGENPDVLAAAIARKCECPTPAVVEPDRPDATVEADVARVTLQVGYYVVMAPVAVAKIIVQCLAGRGGSVNR